MNNKRHIYQIVEHDNRRNDFCIAITSANNGRVAYVFDPAGEDNKLIPGHTYQMTHPLLAEFVRDTEYGERGSGLPVDRWMEREDGQFFVTTDENDKDVLLPTTWFKLYYLDQKDLDEINQRLAEREKTQGKDNK